MYINELPVTTCSGSGVFLNTIILFSASFLSNSILPSSVTVNSITASLSSYPLGASNSVNI